MRLIYRPIDVWPGQLTREREPSPFKSAWPDTLNVLEFELEKLGATGQVVCQLAVDEKDIRLSGELRTGTVIRHPGVILSFHSTHGPLRYACDRFTKPTWRNFVGWHQNVRAIALGLEALRKVDRYGISRGGEQYAGFKALPPGGGPSTLEEAARVLIKYSGLEHSPPDLVNSRKTLEAVYRAALKKAHPDAGGSDTALRNVTAACELIRSRQEA